MKIGLLFDYRGTKDLTNPDKGNPGIGGTQYNFLTLSYYFQVHQSIKVEWNYFCYKKLSLPNFIKQVCIQAQDEIVEKIIQEKIDIFIWRPTDDERIAIDLNKTSAHGIGWIHNVPNPKTLTQLAASEKVKQVVFAGHEALDLVRDHPVIKKSTVIFNGFDPTLYKSEENMTKDPNLVVYLGSLTYAKGFHLLAKIWKSIVEKNPQAKLKVIGSGKLYKEDQQLGKYGIAEATYEDSFMHYLTNDDGDILPSVEFLGLLGREMISYLQQASVGIMNPHGRSEVCPGSAIEFLACGTPVVAGARYGNLDIVDHKVSGYLEKSINKQAKHIINLLNDPGKVNTMGKRGAEIIAHKFSQKRITGQWSDLLNRIQNDELSDKVFPMKSNFLYNFKFLFEALRIIKFKLGLFKNFPSIYEITQRKKFE